LPIRYSAIIQEHEVDLARLEQRLAGTPTAVRIRMLRLLKGGRATSRRQAAALLGYSVSQVNRWWEQYQQHGLAGLTTMKPRLGKQPRVSRDVWAALQEEVQAGRIRRLDDARLYLQEHWGIAYSSPSGVWWLFKRHGVSLKPRRNPQEWLDTDERATLVEP